MTLSANQMTGIAQARGVTAETAFANIVGGKTFEIVGYMNNEDVTTGPEDTEVLLFNCDSTYYPNGLRLLAAYIVPSVAVTGDDTDYETININVKTAAGAAVNTFASHTTKVTGGLGSLTALNRYTLTPDATKALVAAGNIVTMANVLSGAGKLLNGLDGLDPTRVVVVAEVL